MESFNSDQANKKNFKNYNLLESLDSQNDKQEIINQEQLNLQEMLKAQLKETTNLPLSAFAISNCVFGSGILALPFVIRMWGIILGPLFIVLTYFISFYSTHLCLQAKNFTGLTSFSSIGMAAFGRRGSIIVKCLVIVNNFGITLAYLSKALYSHIMQRSQWTAQEMNRQLFDKFLLLYMLILLLLLLYFHFFEVAEVFIQTQYLFTIEKLNSNETNSLSTSPAYDIGTVTCLPTIILAFVYQYNLYNIYRELVQPTDQRFKKASFIGLTNCCLIYLITSLCSYIVYGDRIKENVLENYNEDHNWKDYLLTITFLCNITLVVPMSFFEGRNNILLVIEDIKELRHMSSPIGSSISPTPAEFKKKDKKIYQNKKQFYIGTTVIYCLLMFIATFIPSIKIVFSLTGSIGANSIAFIIPAAFILKLQSGPLLSKKGPLILFVSGVAFSFVCLIAEAISIATHA